MKVQIDGVRPLLSALRRLETGAQRDMKPAWDKGAQLLVDETKPLVPRQDGSAADSLRAASTQKEARVRAGGRKAPYYPWLDFGGRVGRRNSVHRPYKKGGRYLYPTFKRIRPRIIETSAKELRAVARRAGFRA